ncbi:MAG: FtsX-like permease family protein [Coprococcus sp.]
MLTKLIKSNFKNDFSHMVSFFLIITISVVMLHTGLMVLTGYNSLFDRKRIELNSADAVVNYCSLSDEENCVADEIINSAEYIDSYEKLHPIVANFEYKKDGYESGSKDNDDVASLTCLCLPYGSWGDIEKPCFVELSDKEYENPIYLSLFANQALFNAKLDDEIDVSIDDRQYTFQVAGLYEQIISANPPFVVVYVDSEIYTKWKNEFEENKIIAEAEGLPWYDRYIYNIKFQEGIMPAEGAGRLTQAFEKHNIMAYAQDIDMVITDSSYMQNIIAAILSAFSLVITIISIIIIYFRISNSIEQGIESIGALKAIGYTSRQIRMSIVWEFLITTCMAVLSGVGLSYAIMPQFEKGMRTFSGMIWDYSFDILSFVITFVAIVVTVVVVSVISTRKIAGLEPVVALRFGLSTHSFKKNHIPIEIAKGPVTWILALKAVFSNAKQNIMLITIMLAIGAVSTFSVYIADNVVINTNNLYRMIDGISPDVWLNIKNDDALYELKQLPEVCNIWWMDNTEMTVEGYSVIASITDDWQIIPEVNVYEGRVPIYDNEITIGGILADKLGVGIGDEVTVSCNGIEKKYLITGLEQSCDNYGYDISMTGDGAEHLQYKMSKDIIYAMVEGHTLYNAEKLIDYAEAMYGYSFCGYSNKIEMLENGEDPIITIAAFLILLLLIISIAIISLAMNILVKTIIIRKQKEIGIKKAVGFSSCQLRFELVMSMLPQIILGGITGAVIGCLGSNSMMTMLLGSLGIMRSNMKVFPWMGIIAVIYILLVSFSIIWIISARIKRISAYSLITE